MKSIEIKKVIFVIKECSKILYKIKKFVGKLLNNEKIDMGNFNIVVNNQNKKVGILSVKSEIKKYGQ